MHKSVLIREWWLLELLGIRIRVFVWRFMMLVMLLGTMLLNICFSSLCLKTKRFPSSTWASTTDTSWLVWGVAKLWVKIWWTWTVWVCNLSNLLNGEEMVRYWMRTTTKLLRTFLISTIDKLFVLMCPILSR